MSKKAKSGNRAAPRLGAVNKKKKKPTASLLPFGKKKTNKPSNRQKRVPKTKYRFRSAITGELVTEEYANDNPWLTVREVAQAWEHGGTIECAKNTTE